MGLISAIVLWHKRDARKEDSERVNCVLTKAEYSSLGVVDIIRCPKCHDWVDHIVPEFFYQEEVTGDFEPNSFQDDHIAINEDGTAACGLCDETFPGEQIFNHISSGGHETSLNVEELANSVIEEETPSCQMFDISTPKTFYDASQDYIVGREEIIRTENEKAVKAAKLRVIAREKELREAQEKSEKEQEEYRRNLNKAKTDKCTQLDVDGIEKEAKSKAARELFWGDDFAGTILEGVYHEGKEIKGFDRDLAVARLGDHFRLLEDDSVVCESCNERLIRLSHITWHVNENSHMVNHAKRVRLFGQTCWAAEAIKTFKKKEQNTEGEYTWGVSETSYFQTNTSGAFTTNPRKMTPETQRHFQTTEQGWGTGTSNGWNPVPNTTTPYSPNYPWQTTSENPTFDWNSTEKWGRQ